ncbi:DMT family transporter [Salisediminibacterium halotolerans]|uniref:DMT family transporter n=1 Tax=Salisediminibacterium halotolerans TaxID=517425 RepID=UPI000EAB80A7|nr:DMT family transporter [Salisediminibacterium halotolerans]RLJ80896.1 threonine/homoserine efflux transporter RhtA [Actinophytocola xinjiangensis]RPE83918.1 threonine/homoserine efflux transporter RhtA [Salisediminibacterium halotolerans]TWG37840.1 threonine/homoserine efflux transporter RhtA [Salisediminibacterium halotolerans]GEL08455.1 EamA family transporter [Salisediminibacterium halotolerans]
MSHRSAYFMVALGAALWGITGLFVTNLNTYGFTPWEVVGIRLSFSAVLIFLYLFITDRRFLYIRLRHIPFTIGTGIISIAFFNYFFFTVMHEASISLSVVLLYTGPVFVAIISRITFKEPFTANKLIALVFMMTGIAFTVEFFPAGQLSVGWDIVIFGILSGFFYALYSIFGKYISKSYHTLTITAYSMLFGALFLLPTSRLWEKSALFAEPGVLLNGFGLALFATVMAYALYTLGLTYVESSRAAILSTVEPVVAILVGVLIFAESLTFWQVLGFALVLLSVKYTVKPASAKISTNLLEFSRKN